MKKVFALIMLICMAAALCSCALLPGGGGVVTVTYDYGNGDTETRSVMSGVPIDFPDPPSIDNYLFAGWFYDTYGENPVSADAKIYSDTTVYALWSYDYAAVTNLIFDEYIKINVGILASSYNTRYGSVVSEVQAQGSGVIFAQDSTYYYCLTNHHVAAKKDGYNFAKYTIYDCFNNEYEATLECSSAQYDLAIMKFRKGAEELRCVDIADTQPVSSDIVISIGQPKGLVNAVTFGEVLKIEEITLDNTSDSENSVTFPVIWHDAPMRQGSSGGVLLNEYLELVGVNFAVGTDTLDEFICGFTIPYEKVCEYIDAWQSQ